MGQKITEYIQAGKHKTFCWGRHDCVTFVQGWAARVSGRIIAIPEYQTQKEAQKIISKAGGLVALLDGYLQKVGFERIASPAFASHGDIVVFTGKNGKETAGILFNNFPDVLGAAEIGSLVERKVIIHAVWRFLCQQ